MNQETGIQQPDAGQMEKPQAPQGEGGMGGIAPPPDIPGGQPREPVVNPGGEAAPSDCGGHDEGSTEGCSCGQETDQPQGSAQYQAQPQGSPAPQGHPGEAPLNQAPMAGFQDMAHAAGPIPAQPAGGMPNSQPQYQFQPQYQPQQAVQQHPAQQPQYQVPPQSWYQAVQGPAQAMGPQTGHMPGQGCGKMGADADHVHHDENRFGQMADMVGKFIKGEATPADMMNGIFSLNFKNDQLWKGALVGAAAVLLLNNDAVKNSFGKLFGGASKED